MSKDSTDFMITEYERISTAYFGLRDQVNEWFKTYITLVGFPLTVLAAILKFGNSGGLSADLGNLPIIISSLLIVVSFLGFFVTLSIVAMRIEMILYARTINVVRRYFASLDQKLSEYLILPTSDAMPPFFESWRAMFWQVLLIGFLDGIISIVGIQNLIMWGWMLSTIFGIILWMLHLGVYWLLAWRRENDWKVRFSDNLVHPEL